VRLELLRVRIFDSTQSRARSNIDGTCWIGTNLNVHVIIGCGMFGPASRDSGLEDCPTQSSLSDSCKSPIEVHYLRSSQHPTQSRRNLTDMSQLSRVDPMTSRAR
jgi:hypothetical protein